MWADHDVEVRRAHHKQVVHPQYGPLDFTCQVLHIADTDQRVITYCAVPGSHTAEVFAGFTERAAVPR